MTEPVRDYPKGDGQLGCPHCKGRGVVPFLPKNRPPEAIGELTQRCQCVLVRDVLKNLERAWRGLSKAGAIPGSPLKGKDTHNLWITASDKHLREHLKHVGARMGPSWFFRVLSDADLMSAWLSRDIPDDEIYDPDVGESRRSQRTSKYNSLEDIIDPPKLLIVRLGVKAARNSAMPEVLLETIMHRLHVGKPLWVVDMPGYLLKAGHLAWDMDVEVPLLGWPRIVLSELTEEKGALPSQDEVIGATTPTTQVTPSHQRGSTGTGETRAWTPPHAGKKKGGGYR